MIKFISTLKSFVFQCFGITIGRDVKIGPDVFLAKGYLKGKGKISIGNRCELSQGVIMKAYGGSISIAENTFFGEYVTLYGHGGITIGSNTLIAMHTCIISANHTIPDRNTLIRSQGDILLPVKIGNDVWIGAGVKILGGTTIGNGAVIGAGAIVSKDIPPYAIAVGTPAKVIRYRNE